MQIGVLNFETLTACCFGTLLYAHHCWCRFRQVCQLHYTRHSIVLLIHRLAVRLLYYTSMSADEETIQPVAGPVGPPRPARAPANEQTELTERDITEKDGRPFFFRHVTAIVKFCAVCLIAGLTLNIVN